jgi:glutamyl-Q tRNA(Asp) synthetase
VHGVIAQGIRPIRMTLHCGRFAPSPTGPLHFGSLVAALASYVDARADGGRWLVRIEDLDPPREQPGASDAILAALEACALEWDGEVVFQSQRGDAYREALDRLTVAGRTYPCACSRREIVDASIAPGAAGRDRPVYPGTCCNGLPPGRAPRSVRFRVGPGTLAFDDAVQGRIEQDVAREVGDFVLLRADGLFAYQLAVVVDDTAQGVTSIVRGADLLDSTARQIALQRALGARTPRYMHVPVAVDAAGEKLSKQTRAAPLDPARTAPALHAALAFLGQSPEAGLRRASARELVAWAVAHWRREQIPRRLALPGAHAGHGP